MVTLPTATTKQGFPEERTATAKNKEKSSYWASTTTSLEKLARFQQKQLQEKEQKLLQLYDQQRQRAHQVAQRGSANNNNNGSGGNNNQTNVVASHKARAVQDAPSERRRQPKGIDKSYPLEPLRKPSIPTRQQKSIGQPRVNGLHYEINIDDAIDDEAMQRNRMVAKFQPRKSNSVTRKPNSTTSPSGKQNNNPGSPPSPAERGSSRQPQKASSMKFLSRIVGSNGDLEFTTENGYASAPQRKSSMPADLEQKTGVPVVASPRAVTTASPLAPGTNRPNIAGRSNVAAKPRPATTAKVQPPADSTDESNLTACKICNRKFATDRVTLHEQICAKTAQKKRKQFDVVTHRVKGTELESFAIKPLHKKAAKPLKVESEPKVPKSNWRRKHEDFINAIRSAKQMQTYLASGGKLSDLPPPPPSDTSDYIQCPHCSRKFSQGAAERHIPRCTGGNKPKIAPRAKR